MESLRVLLAVASLSCFSLPLLGDSHSESKSFHGWTATVTNYAKDNFSRSCSLIAQPYQLATSPKLVGSNPTDLFIAITHNKLKTTETSFQVRIQLVQKADAKARYFDSTSKAELSFSPYAMRITMNDFLQVGVGSFYLSKSEEKEFLQTFRAANDLILNLDLIENVSGKAVFSLKGSAKALSHLQKNC